MTKCIYCGEPTPDTDMSLEHIWPEALGGDTLPNFWQTRDVCRKCNSMSGLFVDGEFIRGVFGHAEQHAHRGTYANSTNLTHIVAPLAFLGPLVDLPIPPGHMAEFWVGRCGDHVIHIRSCDSEGVWGFSAGGDPRALKKRLSAGRVYVNLTSEKSFWILSCLASVKAHFRKAERYLVNMEVPHGLRDFQALDTCDPAYPEDMEAVGAVGNAAATSTKLRTRIAVRTDTGNRLLAKVGLGLGYRMLGPHFLETEYAKTLRMAFREADPSKRRRLGVKGSGYFSGTSEPALPDILKFRGAWVLLSQEAGDHLFLCVATPTGKAMTVVVSDDRRLVQQVRNEYKDGLVWLTIPALRQSVGPLCLPNYIAHQTGIKLHPQLSEISSKWIDFSRLPPC